MEKLYVSIQPELDECSDEVCKELDEADWWRESVYSDNNKTKYQNHDYRIRLKEINLLYR